MCVHSSVPPFFQLPLHASFHFQMQSRFSHCFAPCAISLVRLGSPRYCRSFSGMLICDMPVSITVLARGKCSQQSLTCPYKRNTSSVRVLAPISYDPPHTSVLPLCPSAPRRCWTLYLCFALCSRISSGRLPSSYLAPLLATQYR